MEQQITVYDERNNKVGMTFPRRARQLVDKGRAIWLGDNCDSICLTPSVGVSEGTPKPEKEERILDKTINANHSRSRTRDREEYEKDAYCDDAELMRLAKKRVKDKKSMLKHIMFYVLAWPVLLFLYAGWLDEYYARFELGFLLGIMFLWGILVLVRIYKYLSLYFRGAGLTLFLRRPKKDQVELEFIRLKRLNPHVVAEESEKV